jgi:hypothetical protein
MAKHPWRFQGDIAFGETDPVVTVFMGDLETGEDGGRSIRQDVRDPVRMKLSQLAGVGDLLDGPKLDGIRLAQKRSSVTDEAAS